MTHDPTNQISGFRKINLKYLNKKTVPAIIPTSKPIIVKTSDIYGLYSIYLPVLLLMYSRSL